MCIFSSFTLPCFASQAVTQMHQTVSFTHTFMYRLSLYIMNFSFTISQLLSNLFSAETHLRYLVIYVTKRVCENSARFKRSFSADHVWRCYMREKQFRQLEVAYHLFNYFANHMYYPARKVD